MAVNSPKLNIPCLRLCVHLCHVISHDYKFSFNGNVYYYREFSYFLKKKFFWKNFPSRTHYPMCLILCRCIGSGMSLKWMPSILKVIWILSEIWKTKSVCLWKTGILFSNDLKNNQQCWELQPRVFNFYQVLFIYKKWDTCFNYFTFQCK